MTDTTFSTPLPAAPVSASERIGEVDVIRGFALFGVLWMNLAGHAEFMIPPRVVKALPTAPIDHWIQPLSDWIMHGKAQCLFSLLFGFGFAILSRRAEARGADARALYLRRILILGVVGFAHLFLLWIGDILHAYALMGLALLLTRRWPDRLLLGLGVFLAVGSFALAVAWLALVTPAGHPPAFVAIQDAGLARRWIVFQGHDYPAFVRELLVGSGDEFYFTVLGPAFLATIFGRFLVGQWIVRKGWMQDTARHAAGFRKAAPWLLIAGFALAAVGPLTDLTGLKLARWMRPVETLVEETSQFVLALGYGAGIVVLCQSRVWRRLLSGLGAAGQMALTNYLTQSLVYVFVLYGFGLGWLKYAGPTFCLAMALVVYAAQVLFSRWWLARFRFGPAEWLWRSATYGTWRPFRRVRAGTRG